MTPEEERMMRAQVEAMLAGGITPGMTGMTPGMTGAGGADPARQAAQARASVSTAGAESKLKAQQAYADQLRNAQAPQGHTAGPLNVYYGPNWGESLAQAGKQVMGGYMQGRMGEDYAALDEANAAKAAAAAEIAQMDLADARGYQTGERVAGQDFTGLQKGLDRTLTAAQGDLNRGISTRGQDMTAASGLANIASREGIATQNIDAAVAAADLAKVARRAESIEGGNYSLGGKVQHIVKDSQGRFRLGTVDGVEVPPETMVNAVEYRPGTEKGTLGDESSFTVPPEDQGQAPPSFVGNMLTSKYFDSSSGMFNPTRWAGAVGVGPDGDMIKATQSQMATTTLGQMAGRMEEINLRPWTEKEIETITKDFPGPNSKYPDWANLTTNILRPDLARRFDEAIALGNSTEEMKADVLMQMDHDVIEGARMNGVSMADLEQLGLPRETITAYLRTL